MTLSSGVLYLVATPIGSLSDFSPHAQSVLSEVGFVICEDTRHSGKLLAHFKIKNHLHSLPSYGERDKAQSLIEKLVSSEKKTAALITDAGTPGISDPGAFLVTCAHEMGVRVLNVPGPSSMACALASCGFIAPRTLFSGFLARQAKEQKEEFARWKSISPCVAVFFESPKRLLKSLENLKADFGDLLLVCVSREISKQFEEHSVGPLSQILSYLQQKEQICGEFVVCVDVKKDKGTKDEISIEDAAEETIALFRETGRSLKDCSKEISQKYTLPTKQVYFIACQRKQS